MSCFTVEEGRQKSTNARLRIGCSKVNCDVYNHLNIPNINPEYPCGEGHENAEHFFMMCTRCNNITIILKRKNEIHCTFTLGVYMEYIIIPTFHYAEIIVIYLPFK